MILFVCYSGMLGGSERALLDFAAGLGGEPCVACPDGALADASRHAGLRVLPLRTRSLHVRLRPSDRLLAVSRLAGHAREARALVAALEPELVVAWGMRSALALLAGPSTRSGTVPIVFQHNDLLPDRLIGALVRLVARRADLVVAASETVARDLDPRGRFGARLKVVHPGVDV